MTTQTPLFSGPATSPLDGSAYVYTDTVRAMFGGIQLLTLYRWIKRGWVPRPVHLGRRLAWRRSVIEAALKDLEATGRLPAEAAHAG
jgi:hypothetical protein